MLRLFFHHRSVMIQIAEALGILALAAMVWRLVYIGAGAAAWTAFAIIAAEYLFIRYCASVRWYKDAAKYSGIELQFKKALSPTAYTIFLGGILFQLVPSAVLLIVMAVLVGIVAHVNVILIYLRFRDSSPLPVNCFTGRNKKS